MLRYLATRGILFVAGVFALGLLFKAAGWYTIPAAITGAVIYWAGTYCGIQMERERNLPPYRAPWEE